MHFAGVISLLLLSGPVLANQPHCGDFPDNTLSKWKEREFKGRSEYALIEKDGQRVLRGTTNSQASVLYRQKTINLNKTPVIEWCWQIEKTYAIANDRVKAGDDFPARLYIVHKTGLLPWETVALNYVWSSASEKDSVWNSPFTSKSRMIAVQSGDESAGTWSFHKRNIKEDFKRYFGINVKKIEGYALMIDGDSARQSGTAYFGNVKFRPDAADQPKSKSN